MVSKLIFKDLISTGNKHTNTLKVFKTLYSHGSATIKQLSERAGLSKPTVKKALRNLGEKGLVIEKGQKDTPTGRKPVIYEFDGSTHYLLGIDMEIPDLRVALYDLSKRLIVSKSAYLNMEKLTQGQSGYVQETLINKIEDLVKGEGLDPSAILGLGVGVPGMVKEGSFKPFSRLESQNSIKLKESLEEALKIPVTIGNDVDLELLSELEYRELLNSPDIVAVYVAARMSGKIDPEVRIGGSIFQGGEIFRGANGSAGEFGHTSVALDLKEEFPRCRCGNDNCLEAFVNNKIKDLSQAIVPEEVKQALEQKLQDLIFIFNPSLLIIDLDAFPEITKEILSKIKNFSIALETRIGINELMIDIPTDSKMACTRGAIISSFSDLLKNPEKYAIFH